MKRFIEMLAIVLIAASAHAACGGGGYSSAQPQASAPAPVTATRYESPNSAPRTTANFDTSFFHRISGRLNLNYQQSTQIISMENEIRRELANGKQFDPKKEFETRLSRILSSQQFRNYQSLKS